MYFPGSIHRAPLQQAAHSLNAGPNWSDIKGAGLDTEQFAGGVHSPDTHRKYHPDSLLARFFHLPAKDRPKLRCKFRRRNKIHRSY